MAEFAERVRSHYAEYYFKAKAAVEADMRYESNRTAENYERYTDAADRSLEAMIQFVREIVQEELAGARDDRRGAVGVDCPKPGAKCSACDRLHVCSAL